MIPIRLELKNFLPYRSPAALQFDGIHLACLTGPNGAGKSSLLDAITWVLWGEARAGRVDDLIHLGERDMYVQLDFVQEGITWRVTRQRSGGKGGKGSKSSLSLQMFTPDGSLATQNESSIPLTQAKIARLLRLDYNTFVHSAFLQQGKADAFTTLTPAKRKQILSDILGLDQWARYEDRVKTKLKQIGQEVYHYEMTLRDIDARLAARPEWEQQLAEAEAAHTAAQSAREDAEAQLQEVAGAPGDLRNARANRIDRADRLQGWQREHTELVERLTRQQAQITEYAQVIDQRDEIEAGYRALQSAREADESLNEKLRDLRTIDERRHDLQSGLDAARARLESEAEALAGQIAELEAEAARDVSAELAAVAADVAALQGIEIECAELESATQQTGYELENAKAQHEALLGEGTKQRDRCDRLKDADDDDATCPVCGQPLDAEQRQRLVAELDAELEVMRGEYRASEQRIHETRTRLEQQEAEVARLKRELKRMTPLSERLGVLRTQAEASEQAAERLGSVRERLAESQRRLAEGDFAADVRAALIEVEREQAALGYDEISHDSTRALIAEHRRYEALQTRLSGALEAITGVQEVVQELESRRDRLTESIAALDGEIAALDVEIAGLIELANEYTQREEALNRQRMLELNAHGRLVSVRQELGALDRLAEDRRNYEERLTALRVDESLYNELKQAFGKNGIPAMMIETAIPELEAEANNLLARMTDGRMHLRFPTQKEKVKGGMAETLDLEIADELGTRNYELYSGGEAFRINFAVRVALSKLLARRAGANLRTLFIDEGFGTQDDVGRNKLVEAITAIQHDFDLILVITHIDELRDSFPVHIVVDKTASGSQMYVR